MILLIVNADIDNNNNESPNSLFAVNVHSTVFYFIISINFDPEIR